MKTVTERFNHWLGAVKYRDWDIGVYEKGEVLYLQIKFNCELDGPQSCRKWLLSEHMTKNEVVQTAFKAVLAAEEHEIREKFKYRGRPIFSPHFDLDEMVSICDRGSYDLRS